VRSKPSLKLTLDDLAASMHEWVGFVALLRRFFGYQSKCWTALSA
jgi:hypothetical protein